jgi:threonine dehydratase
MAHPMSNRIAVARSRIDPVFLNTPVIRDDALQERFGVTILFKDERVTPIGSFKGRGAELIVQTYPPGTRFLCASAGNFGQGMAWAARRHGCALTVYAAKTAVPCKIKAMARLGADVILEGCDFEEAKSAAQKRAESSGEVFIVDGEHAEIAEGAGTLALELTESCEPLDVVFVPLGNGALAAGVGCWLKYKSPSTHVVAVAAKGAPAMGLAVLGRPFELAPCHTIADGIAVRVPIPAAVDAVRKVVDEVTFVDDPAIRRAMEVIESTTQSLVEPAGAVGLAALMDQKSRWQGLRAAIPLCGRNREP